MSAASDEIDRLTTSIADAIRVERELIKTGWADLSAAFDKAVKRLGSDSPGSGGSVAAAAGAGGIASVLVTNDKGSPVPVFVTNQAPLPVAASTDIAGMLGAVGTGVGNVIGGIAGGLLGGAVAPIAGAATAVAAFADLVVIAAMVPKILELVDKAQALVILVVAGLHVVIQRIFKEFTDAEIFPVTRLFSAAKKFIEESADRVANKVNTLLDRIQPIIDGVLVSFRPLLAWLDSFVGYALKYVSGIVDRTATFLNDYLVFARTVLMAGVSTALRAALASVIGLFLGVFATVGEYLIASGEYLAAVIGASIRSAALSFLIGLYGVLFGFADAHTAALTAFVAYFFALFNRQLVVMANLMPFGTKHAVPEAPELALTAAIQHGFEQGMQKGRSLAETQFGPAGPAPEAPVWSAIAGREFPQRMRAEELAAQILVQSAAEIAVQDILPGTAELAARRLAAPEYESQPWVAPARPSPADRVLKPAPAPAPSAPAAQPTTFNGGVKVEIRSETVSMDNAEATARAIAAQLMDEVARLTQADRFSRGLPTSGVH